MSCIKDFLDCFYENLILFHVYFQLDSATSLIQAAKNLMNAVVLTVKCSYVASTKYPRQGTIAVSAKVFFVLLSFSSWGTLIYCDSSVVI